MEALAKGAVQFSRRYTYQELYKRWDSLLHDPDISTQAADRIFELEISGINPAPKLNRSEINFTGNKEVSKKRKFESIRRKYYAMRKKIRSELFSKSDLGFFEPNSHEFSGHDGNSLGQNCMIRDDLSDHLGLQEEDLDILRQAFPGTITDIAVSSGAANVSHPESIEENCQNRTMGGYRFDGNVASSLDGGTNNLEKSINENPHNSSVGFEGREQFDTSNSGAFSSFQTVVFPPTQSHLRHLRTMQHVTAPPLQDTAQVTVEMIQNDKENNSAAYSGEFADPDSLLNLSNEDEILLVDEDEKCAANKCCIDDTDSVIKDSNQDGKENEIPKPESETSVNPVALEVAESSVNGDPQMNCQPEVDMPSKSTSNSDIPGLSDGKICCTLNTEDTEIPCNDDIFLLIHPSSSFDSSAAQPNTTGSVMTSTTYEKGCEQAFCLPAKAKDSVKDYVWPHTVGVNSLPESRAANIESLDSRSQALRPGFANKAIGNSSKAGSLYALPTILAKKEVTGLDMKVVY